MRVARALVPEAGPDRPVAVTARARPVGADPPAELPKKRLRPPRRALGLPRIARENWLANVIAIGTVIGTATGTVTGTVTVIAIGTVTVIDDGAAVIPGVAAVALARASLPRERSTRNGTRSES